MYIGDEESYGLDETESVTLSINPVRNSPPRVDRRNDRDDYDILQVIVDALQRVARTSPATTSTQNQRWALIKELRKYGATEFMGLKGVDPSVTENWMESTKRILQQLDCTPRECLICVVSLLQGEAYLWWESVVRHLSEKKIIWDLFQKEFQKKYIEEIYIKDKKQEFLMLQQGDLSVIDYERVFKT
ncbi:uncharacterized protein LOC108487753 [Gossypium arboreum]|uniref:Retrotransposon gag domain-containing protein n=1 Tax=Gossypium arboreum TaxID=29729 RepID=A0ABR0NH00_GOSAR|nr:uncharacterized protein LOC108487753 [Gossypium arboreum]KAK5793952.1 hypothetical protein PVK06_035134 [Gossypium arboreum]